MSNQIYDPPTREELIDEMRTVLEEELLPLVQAKGHDYTGDNQEDTLANVGDDLGWAGAFIRGRDKDRRKRTALLGKELQVSDDSMRNNFVDRINYAFYEYILWRRRKVDIKIDYVPIEDEG